MSSFLREKVLRVPPMSRRAIEMLALQFSQQLAPETLRTPCALNLLALTEHVLPERGIHFCSASEAELPDQHAATNPAGSGPIDVLMREKLWYELPLPGPRSNFARSTASHEIGHAVLHVAYFRRVRTLHPATGTLNRTERRQFPAYEDPEWQAWEFARAILMPARSIRAVAGSPVRDIAVLFNVSPVLVQKRLETLGLAR
jgi:hypothetical protein